MRPFHLSMLVIVGLGMGLASALAPGALFLAGLCCAIAFSLRRSAEPADRRFLVALFLGSFLLRVALSLALDLGSVLAEGRWPAKTAPVTEWSLGIADVTRQYLKLGDSDYNSERGYALDQYVRGHREEPIVLLRIKQNRPHGYLYAIGLFYHLFGFSPISVKWINGLAGALLGAVVFLLARSFCGPSVARTASVWVSLFPSMLLWSVANLKEPSFILLGAVLLLLAVKIRQAGWTRRIPLYGAAFALTLITHMTLRSDAGFSWLLAGCVLLSFPLSWMKSRWQLLALGLLPVAVWAAVLWIPAVSEKISFVLYRHIGNVYQDQTSMTYSYLPFSLQSDFWAMGLDKWAAMIRTDPPFLLQAVCRAVFHYLLEPLPGRTGDLFTLTVLPQMILWYFLLPCAAWGMWVGLRRHPQGTPFLLTTALAWTVAGGLAAGNVGLVFRVRDMVTPLFLIFSSIGIHGCLGREDPWR